MNNLVHINLHRKRLEEHKNMTFWLSEEKNKPTNQPKKQKKAPNNLDTVRILDYLKRDSENTFRKRQIFLNFPSAPSSYFLPAI